MDYLAIVCKIDNVNAQNTRRKENAWYFFFFVQAKNIFIKYELTKSIKTTISKGVITKILKKIYQTSVQILTFKRYYSMLEKA